MIEKLKVRSVGGIPHYTEQTTQSDDRECGFNNGKINRIFSNKKLIMNQNFYRYISFFGLSFLRKKNLEQLKMLEKDIYFFLKDLAIKNGAQPNNIKSQIYQDIFVLYTLNWKRNGFFVEFGATNGFDLSNSYLLEKDFGWKGILCEPG